MFSIADIQNMEEESEFDQENEESGEEDHAQSYPTRVSFSVTKVIWLCRRSGRPCGLTPRFGTGRLQGFAQH